MFRIIVLTLGVVLAGCSGSGGRDMIAFQATCESRISPAEKFLSNYKEAMKFAPPSTAEHQQAVDALAVTVNEARQKILAMTTSGTSWQDHKTAIDSSLVAVETAFAKAKSTP